MCVLPIQAVDENGKVTPPSDHMHVIAHNIQTALTDAQTARALCNGHVPLEQLKAVCEVENLLEMAAEMAMAIYAGACHGDACDAKPPTPTEVGTPPPHAHPQAIQFA